MSAPVVPLEEKDTVSVAFVLAAVARLNEAQRGRALAAAGIPAELLRAPQSRVTADAFAALWLAVARELDDEFFGLDRRRMKAGSFNMLCRSLLPAGDLGQALRRVLRGFNCLLDDVTGALALRDDAAVVTVALRIEDAEARRFAVETFLVLVHGLMCWLAGRRIPLRWAHFAYPRPAHAREYALMYSPQLVFDAECTAIAFDAALLALPVAQDERSLKTFLAAAPRSVFLKYRNEEGVAARVRRRLKPCVEAGADWPRLEEVAAEMHLSTNTLRRRLAAEGASYQGLKDALRRDAAIHLLTGSRLSVEAIGARLGYEDASAFHRAFRKWLGMQPGEYRARAHGPRPSPAEAG
ncbi:AraC family transcriptional regulator [Azohydromonas caseinilytica]|uniref:AraC family transcriptional regulator n=1 Tax=Azohydromonas caseinilytica TaxID=2728836 RepID=A0A848FEX6_9BURK|nr:AraC family transcriptional regulator [Azohydromonas caseinilytica]NML17968.1 AraC family transcriptional regulator [Azohydromonas caseinilytica]